ncbi:MAG: type II toxin-antitoxin system VapC family toxin [Verrucomicrobia bacterium]|nr:type II toxin-antitoxin system VapC family toxin [Verrucomicrobiota bacterium]
MNLAIDTNRYRDFCEGLEDTVAIFQRADRIGIPFSVLAELRAGFACGTVARRNEGVLNTFLNRPRVTCLFADEQTTFHYARIYRQLREQGTPIPTNDIWIASLVQQHNLLLYSRDRHFEHLPQLARVG